MNANKQQPIAAPHPDIQAGDDDCDDDAAGDGVADADANANADGNDDDDDEVAGSGELQLQLQLEGLWTPDTHSPAVQSLHFIMYARHRQWATDGRAAIALPLVASSSN
ncbi:GM11561 [Drosophila sechellia]|uniref:GM11561 n=1 Tax=Drosophila sechellia TaxID=7238 RepID=B4IGF5_DROSE|nr:GM11561 [Drosophila sechellia]